MKLYIHDFDNNGTIEQITAISREGKDYPIHQKRELTEQLVSLKKENLKASDYARRTVQELFSPQVMQQAIVKSANYSASVIAFNEGNGQFRIQELPSPVQLSCVCGIQCADVNGDGHTDLIMAGNNYEFKPQFSRLDASYGHVLLGEGKGDFNWQNFSQSGLFIKDEVKHLGRFKDKNGSSYFIAAINDNQPKVYALQ